MNPSNVRRDSWLERMNRSAVRKLDTYSLRHRFASLGRVAAKIPSTSLTMGHSRLLLVDQVYAHYLRSSVASVAERITARALGTEPKLREIADEKKGEEKSRYTSRS